MIIKYIYLKNKKSWNLIINYNSKFHFSIFVVVIIMIYQSKFVFLMWQWWASVVWWMIHQSKLFLKKEKFSESSEQFSLFSVMYILMFWDGLSVWVKGWQNDIFNIDQKHDSSVLAVFRRIANQISSNRTFSISDSYRRVTHTWYTPLY